MATPLGQRIVDIHNQLDAAGIAHAFGGAIALAYHIHHPRSTNDVDINVAVDADRAEFVMRSLPPQVRWDGRSIRIAELTGEVKLRWMNEGGVDLFFDRGPYYDLVDQRKELRPLLGVQIPILSATDLVVFKARFGRDKDWVDVRAMLEAGTPDVREAQRCLEELTGPPARQRLQRAVAAFERGDSFLNPAFGRPDIEPPPGRPAGIEP